MVTTYWQKDFFFEWPLCIGKRIFKKKMVNTYWQNISFKWSLRIGKRIFFKNSYYVLAKGYFFKK